MKLEDYMSVKEAARVSGIKHLTLHQRIFRGTVPVERIDGRIVLIHKDVVKSLKPEKSGARIKLPWRKDDPNRSRSHPLYQTYHNMLRRCYSPSCKQYPHYGGRGITVCDRWLNSFKAFRKDMGKKPGEEYSIDRWPDNDGNYEPGNCRWATPKEQANNKKRRGSSKC